MKTVVFYDELCGGDFQVEFDKGDADAERVAFVLLSEHLERCPQAQRAKAEREIIEAQLRPWWAR